MKNVLVIFGGRSAEHDVSIVTALVSVIPSLKASGKYTVHPLYITQDGSWYCDPSLLDIKTFQNPDFTSQLKKMKKVQLLFDNGLILTWPSIRTRQQKIDVAFTAMHGTYGEDGSLMGLLRMAGVPFVGCDLFASAVAMDKVITKQVTGAVGLPSPRYEWFMRHDWQANQSAVEKKLKSLKYPLFVKPVHLGSSIAITKVQKPDQLVNAIEVALHYDDKVIVEEGVPNLIEVTVPVMGNAEPRVALVERALNKSELFNFEDKYIGQGKKGGGKKGNYSELPAKIDPKLIKASEQMAIAAYRAIGAAGISRVDLLIDGKTGKVYLNEINTLPGALYDHNWRAAGVSGVELVDELIRLAEERFNEQKKINFNFKSNIIGQF